ncbi:MAG: pyridoxamine 5'-phosphate oxidase family protein [Prevotellaceae bacterium]|nr:pyridoxamine 5'-phosphate oxidase family protein [Prevotellaceae bacterium]
MRNLDNGAKKKAECLKVMESSSFVSLTTIDKNGFPSTRAMLNLRNKEQYPHLVRLYETENNPLTVYLTTNTSSEKFGEIRQNGKACRFGLYTFAIRAHRTENLRRWCRRRQLRRSGKYLVI